MSVKFTNLIKNVYNFSRSYITKSLYNNIDIPLSINNTKIITNNITNNTKISKKRKRINTVEPLIEFSNIVKNERKQESKNIQWNNSKYKNLIQLQSNNVGKVGEIFIANICNHQKIKCSINGLKSKNMGIGDGLIKNKSIEIKTAHKGINGTFQHELGEHPWTAQYMLFLDISPFYIYLTIIPNFSEKHYKNRIKCTPSFPTRSICWRKKSGAFKFDTTESMNEFSILNNTTIKITDYTTYKEIKSFIIKNII